MYNKYNKYNKYEETISYYDILNWKSYKAENNKKYLNYWEFNRLKHKNKVYKFMVDIEPKDITKKLLKIIYTHLDYVKNK